MQYFSYHLVRGKCIQLTEFIEFNFWTKPEGVDSDQECMTGSPPK